jgi:hypothetical protein
MTENGRLEADRRLDLHPAPEYCDVSLVWGSPMLRPSSSCETSLQAMRIFVTVFKASTIARAQIVRVHFHRYGLVPTRSE